MRRQGQGDQPDREGVAAVALQGGPSTIRPLPRQPGAALEVDCIVRLRITVPLALTALSLAALACNLGRTDQGGTSASQPEMTLEEALAVPAEDRRPEVLRLMGIPDSFTLSFQELDGQPVRLEEWSYFDSESRFDFVDGELAWTIDIPAASDGSLFAHQYDPLEFDPSMTISDIQAMFPDQTFEEESLAEADAPQGIALVGDQILLGFDGGRLVFVQTFVLSPDGEAAVPPTGEAPTTATPGSGPSTPVAAPPTSPPAAADRFVDDFDGSSPAQPLFGSEFMAFAQENGEGILTSRSPGGVVPVMYAEPVLADFELEVDIRFPQAQSGGYAGIVFRSDDAAGGLAYYYHFVFRPSAREVKLDLWDDGWTTLARASIPTGVLAAGGRDRLRVEAEGSELKLFVNDQLLLDVDHSLLEAPGFIGLSLVAAQSSESVAFDNLRIEKMDQ